MKKYRVNFLDKGAHRADEFHAYSTNEAAIRAKERYGNHIVTGAIVEIKS
jgi:hypothetical protein